MQHQHHPHQPQPHKSLAPLEAEQQMQAWEAHMLSHSPGRQSAFELSAELIFNRSQSDTSTLTSTLKLADLGCGFGGWSAYIQGAAWRQAQPQQLHFTALDASARRLEVYQTLLGPSVRLLQGDFLTTLPELAQAEAGSLDAVFFGWAAHEIAEDQLQSIYTLLYQLLKPGGQLLIADFVSGLKPEVATLARELTQQRRAEIMADPKRRQQEQSLQAQHGHHHGHQHGHQHGQAHQHGHGQPHQQRTPRHYQPAEHFQFLKTAGFELTEEVWRYLNSSLIMAVKA